MNFNVASIKIIMYRDMEVRQTVQELLKNVAVQLKYGDYTVEIESDSENANIMSALFHATLSAPGKPDLMLFVKVATMKEKLRKEASFIPYEIELYFYSKLKKLFQSLEEKYGLPVTERIRTPKLYGLLDEYLKETLAFEDLAAQGYKNFNRAKSADMDYMYAGIDLMAKFHALSMAYHRDYPDDFRQTTQFLTFKADILKEFLISTKSKLLTNALAAIEGEHKMRLQKYFDKPESFLQLLNNYCCYGRNILVHGDFKPANLMHRRRNGKLELAILDFQMVHNGNPVAELLYFIFTATDEQFRRDHYHELLDLYYERLRVALHNLRLEPEIAYPEKFYREQLEENRMLGLVLAVAVLPVILVENNKAPGFDREDSDLSDFVTEGSALFKERFNGVVNNYVEWGLL